MFPIHVQYYYNIHDLVDFECRCRAYQTYIKLDFQKKKNPYGVFSQIRSHPTPLPPEMKPCMHGYLQKYSYLRIPVDSCCHTPSFPIAEWPHQ